METNKSVRNKVSVEACYTAYGVEYIVRTEKYVYTKSRLLTLDMCIFGGADVSQCDSHSRRWCFEVEGNVVKVYASGEAVEVFELDEI